MPMIDAALQGFGVLLVWPTVGYLFLGIAIGIVVGILPGLGGLSAVAIMLPFSFLLDVYSAMALLMGMYAVTTTSDTISAVLLGVPGTSASQATILDGYPMARNGEAGRAFGAAYTVSAIGGVVGGLCVIVSLPVIREVVLSFGSPEFFMLAVLGLVIVGSLSGKAPLRGLVVVLFALALSMVGSSPQEGLPRYTFDTAYLLGGIKLVPAVLGLFALPEVLELFGRGSSIARLAGDPTRGMVQGMRDVLTHWWLVVRSIAIGVYIGVIPGLGASIVDWVAYGHAVQTEKNPERFGTGDVRGVIAPEAANNAVKGGALIPTLAIGVPGSPPMALLLVALTVHGISPGPDILGQRLDVLFSLVGALIFANIVAAALLLVATTHLARIAEIRGTNLVAIVLVAALMGSWMATRAVEDWYTFLAFGVLGYFMKRWNWPRPPICLGLVLGPLIERYLHLSINVYGFEWLLHPLVVVLEALVVLVLVTQIRRSYRSRG
jgi:TctA family transporter